MPTRSRSSLIPSGLVWRIGLAITVVTLALVAFTAGVETSERAGVPTAGLAAHLYYAIGLFVLAGMELGVPSGGPAPARTLLWIAYFIAPALTAGAVAEGLIRAWNPDRWQRRGLRDHVVIVGLGQVGQLYLAAIRQLEPRRRVLVVDRSADHPNRAPVQIKHGAVFLHGDAKSATVRDAMRLDRALGVVLATGSDLTNLEVAIDVLGEYPELRGRIASHVADVGLERTVARVLRGGEASRSTNHEGYRVFNAHRIAADELVNRRLIPRFEQTQTPDVVVIAGFGRFGQTILEVLQERAEGEFSGVVIVDRVADSLRRQFAERVGFARTYRCETLQADLADPATWERVGELMQELGRDSGGTGVTVVLGTDDDQLNIRTAMLLSPKAPLSHVVVRCFSDSSLTRQLSADGAFQIFGVSRLLQDALATRHRQWFLS